MPVYKLLAEMPYEEMVKWISFFKKQPVGWREDKRTYMLLSAQGVKASEEEIFPSLRMLKAGIEESQTPDQAVPKGVFLDLMARARGSDKRLDPKTGEIK